MILFDEGYGPAWDARLRLDELSPVEALRVDSRTAEAVRAALLIALTCLGRGDAAMLQFLHEDRSYEGLRPTDPEVFSSGITGAETQTIVTALRKVLEPGS